MPGCIEPVPLFWVTITQLYKCAKDLLPIPAGPSVATIGLGMSQVRSRLFRLH